MEGIWPPPNTSIAPWAPRVHNPKRRLDRFSHFCKAHACDQQTVGRPRHICNKKPHFTPLCYYDLCARRCGLLSNYCDHYPVTYVCPFAGFFNHYVCLVQIFRQLSLNEVSSLTSAAFLAVGLQATTSILISFQGIIEPRCTKWRKSGERPPS